MRFEIASDSSSPPIWPSGQSLRWQTSARPRRGSKGIVVLANRSRTKMAGARRAKGMPVLSSRACSMLALVPSACGWYTNVQPWRMPPRSHDAAVMTANFRPGYIWWSASDSASEDDGVQSADWPFSVNVSDAVSGASSRLNPQSDLGDATSRP